jgi:hypothetical protein
MNLTTINRQNSYSTAARNWISKLFVVCLLLFKNNVTSQNIIQNCSFELTTNLNCSTGPILNVNNWSVIASPDYFIAACNSIGNSGMPNNKFGSCYPKNGIAYVGIGTIMYPYETKEYLIQHLSNPLVAGKTYYTSFFLSKSDRTRIATEKIGAYFSLTQPTVPSGTVCLIASPQVENQSGYLTDTIGWAEISGYFTAQGGEEYMTIGNFNSNANTDTLHTGTTNPFFSDAGTAYYYIDSVSLYDSLTYMTGTKQYENNIKLNVYPNPNDGNFNLEYSIKKEAEFVITDIAGQIVNQYTLFPTQNNLPIKEEKLNSGIYFYYVRQEKCILRQNKIVIIK